MSPFHLKSQNNIAAFRFEIGGAPLRVTVTISTSATSSREGRRDDRCGHTAHRSRTNNNNNINSHLFPRRVDRGYRFRSGTIKWNLMYRSSVRERRSVARFQNGRRARPLQFPRRYVTATMNDCREESVPIARPALVTLLRVYVF
ncbi:hypothetical protein EVAR_58516_1 [Eumeta japonica]|uniref:Uncharacterized protein n=1 Tax=Eumeta variegata TaxID=151549 RepID=A0A4C1YYT9_EUMVA|nr:hypothetical protein EVAR_58516_1 [Eumeta japonica]